jgi:hypothetical protein
LADRTSQLLLSALSRAAAEPAGLPLHPARGVPGLFPASAVGRQAGLRATVEGYLRPSAVPAAVPAGSEAAATRPVKVPAEVYVLTDKGLSYLLSQTSPRPILEDFVRVLETRHAQASGLLNTARQMLAELSSLRLVAERVLERTRDPGYTWVPDAVDEPEPRTAEAVVLDALSRHQSRAGSGEDCPLPELFRHASDGAATLTVGQFHDALRRLNDAGRVYLHPWTGPLYDVPEPAYALLVGHVVAYYASIRKSAEVRTQNAD